jgi:hypothetical protein
LSETRKSKKSYKTWMLAKKSKKGASECSFSGGFRDKMNPAQ